MTDAAKLWVASNKMMKNHLKLYGGFVYIMTNKNRTTLYTGVTSDLASRVLEHKEKHYPKCFTAKYNCDKLVYYFFYDEIVEAISREKQIKAGSRNSKIKLIEGMNPEWKDLYIEFILTS